MVQGVASVYHGAKDVPRAPIDARCSHQGILQGQRSPSYGSDNARTTSIAGKFYASLKLTLALCGAMWLHWTML